MIELWPIWAVRLSEQTNIGLGVQKSNRNKTEKIDPFFDKRDVIFWIP